MGCILFYGFYVGWMRRKFVFNSLLSSAYRGEGDTAETHCTSWWFLFLVELTHVTGLEAPI
jgi:hypothetical protein